MDATLWYGLGVGFCGVGASSRSCEVAHAMDATLVMKIHTGKIDNCWKLAKNFLPTNLLTKSGQNKDVMMWLRAWQWRYEKKTTTLLKETAALLRAQ